MFTSSHFLLAIACATHGHVASEERAENDVVLNDQDLTMKWMTKNLTMKWMTKCQLTKWLSLKQKTIRNRQEGALSEIEVGEESEEGKNELFSRNRVKATRRRREEEGEEAGQEGQEEGQMAQREEGTVWESRSLRAAAATSKGSHSAKEDAGWEQPQQRREQA